MFKSATIKLTLWYMAIISAICLSFSVVLYHFANQELQNGLLNQSSRILEQYPGFDFDPALRPGSDYTQGSHRILLNLIYFNVFVLITAGFTSYALAKRTLRSIEWSHKQQQRFTADVSHELRTPLTALRMSSEVALLDPKADKADLQETLRSNLEDADTLERLINSLLRLTQLEASELQQSFQSVDLKSVVHDAVAAVSHAAGTRRITIKNQVDTSLSVMGDHASLVQLLTILLDNAIKYSPAGQSVTIAASLSSQHILLSIVDQGMGIEPEALAHVFDRFYRADRARSNSQTGGFGLGLSIAKHIADIHHGTITLKSRSGHGTTAIVRLPQRNPRV